LPAQISVQSFRYRRRIDALNDSHGIRCAEVVHQLAPGAELYFADWESNDPQTILSAVAWARQSGVRVVCCAYHIPKWGDGEGHGRLQADLARVLGPGNAPGDMLFVCPTGNEARSYWAGDFKAGADGYHQWKAGEAINSLKPYLYSRNTHISLYGPP